MRKNFDNTTRLVRFMLRRERVVATIWIVILVAFSVILAPGLDGMFPDDAARQDIMAIYDNPVMVSMMGPIYGDTTGAMYASMMLLWYLIAVGVMNIFIAVRHTRADEEQWRAEVIRSLPVGRLAGIHATMLTALIINALLALFTGLGMAITQTPTMDFAGCMLYGAVSGAVGLAFAAIALVFCQLSQSSSGALGLSFAALGGAYMLRAAGDIGNEVLSLISPLGLPLRSMIFVENRILPLIALLSATVAIAALAYKLNSVRDLGQGFIAARPGRSEAKKSLLSPFGLSMRLCKKMLIIWLIVMFCAGASYGTVLGDIGSYVSNMPQYLEIVGLPAEVIEAVSDEQMEELTEEYADMIVEYFGVFITGMMTLIGLIPVLMIGLRLRNEEKEGRIEHVISRSVSKAKYLFGYVIIAFVLSILVQFMTAVGLYAVASTAEKNPFVLADLITAYLSQLPAMWVMLGVAVLLTGLLPKLTGAAWGYYGLVCFLVFMGNLEVFPAWFAKLSPLYHIPKAPQEELAIMPLAILTIISVLFTATGLISYKNRDMATY
jgi:ABC-2 type transport system permease protein